MFEFDLSKVPEVLQFISMLIGGAGLAGGLAFWWDRWRGRIRIRVRPLRMDWDGGGETIGRMFFEVENVGREPTSLRPTVRMIGYWAMGRDGRLHGSEEKIDLHVDVSQRSLRPFEPPAICAIVRGSAATMSTFVWFPRVTVKPTRGARGRMYLRNSGMAQLGALHYWVALIWFRMTGRFPDKVD